MKKLFLVILSQFKEKNARKWRKIRYTDQKQGEILKYKPWEDQPKAKKEKFRHPI